MTCPAHPWGLPEGLDCQRPDPHVTGHEYVSTTGSDVDDRHSEGGHG